jgi:hypothetical protein
MQTLAESNSRALANLHGNQKDSGLPTSIEKTLNARNKQQLAELLSQTCALQKAYGKTQAELETLVEGFSWALAEYRMPEIIRGMREYILTHSDIPAPADIIKIIDAKRHAEAVQKPSIERLREYQEKGIPLTPEQQAMLEIA